jgi:hypothetical protein
MLWSIPRTLLLMTVLLMRLVRVNCFSPVARYYYPKTTVLLHGTLLSDETMARLQQDYRDLKEAFHYQVRYFQKDINDADDDITEDSLEHSAYMTHLKRFQQEQNARLASDEHTQAAEELERIRDEWERWHDDKIIQDFEYEMAQAEEAKAHDKERRALYHLRLLEKSEWDLKEALQELREANNMDQVSLAELRKHQSLLHSFKAWLIDHDPFKGNVAF